jgi:NHLM bacteriocin system ABC transporter peptidase/ATP-binding protein
MGEPFLAKRRPQRIKTPTVLQMEAAECGAAALAIILGYHGKFVPLEELRLACGVSRNGSKASNIIKAARRYGLKGSGFSKDIPELLSMQVPFIVYWNFNHFVVVEGFRKGRVYLNDPAVGPRTVTEKEFSTGFTGVVLVFEPTPDFAPEGTPHRLLGALRRRLADSGATLIYVLLASLMLVLPGLAVPAFTKVFVDYYLVGGRESWIVPLLLGMALAAALRMVLTWLQQHHLLRLETKLALTSSYRFFHHVLRLPVEFFTQRYGGEIGWRVGINDRIAQLLSGQLTTCLLNALLALLYLTVIVYLDVLLAMAVVPLLALNALALAAVARRRKDANQRLLQERGKLMGTLMSTLQNIETVKAIGTESGCFARLSGNLAKVLLTAQSMGVYTVGIAVLPPFFATLSFVGVLWMGTLRVTAGQMTVGTLVAIQSLVASLMDPIRRLTDLGAAFQEVEGEMIRLDDVLRYPADPMLGEADGVLQANEPFELTGRIDLRGLSFGYSRLDAPLIENFSLSVTPGARVAIVGPTASGKTTLARLIAGLYRPWSGEVLFDGLPRERIPRVLLTSSVALVDQDICIIEGTFRDVLTLWDSTIPEEQMVRGAKDACIHEDITSRPGSYDSHVFEAGANLSGGQRQRLEIARALVIDPRVLILDEATSAIDALTEKQIDENLRRRGCTCVIVAHRLSTIRDCDEIIVLDKGAVVERGTHGELWKAAGLYRKLMEM